MTIRLTDAQIEQVLRCLPKDKFIDFLAEDVETSVDWICKFIRIYVDSETLQNKLKDSFPPIQMELWK
jgi:hypothetical protein